MNAPIIWIFIPFAAGMILLFIRSVRTVIWTGGVIAAFLAVAALLIPIDRALLLGGFSFKISPSVQILGRSLALNTADGPVLGLIYGVAAVWFFGTEAAGVPSRFVALGLSITALLVGSTAVEPFLFAAPMLETASLLVIPLLVPPSDKPGRGVLRFLIYQTLAMPFLLFSGWMLAGVEASPGDIALTTTAGIMLGFGFAFLLAVFPLYSWIPMLAEESSPYAVGFLLWALTTFAAIFALGFLDRYVWIRTSPQLSSAIRFAGLFMVASGGIFAAFQRHLGRMMGYASIIGTGMMILAMSLNSSASVEITFLLVIPRGLELAIWSLSIAAIKQNTESLKFSAVQGIARAYPMATGALVLANLSAIGFPLLAGFPPRLALWEELARQSLGSAFWVLIGILGLLIGAVRTLAIFVIVPENTPWKLNESWTQSIMLGVGVIGLFIVGMFPQLMQPFLTSLPALFEHIGQ